MFMIHSFSYLYFPMMVVLVIFWLSLQHFPHAKGLLLIIYFLTASCIPNNSIFDATHLSIDYNLSREYLIHLRSFINVIRSPAIHIFIISFINVRKRWIRVTISTRFKRDLRHRNIFTAFAVLSLINPSAKYLKNY